MKIILMILCIAAAITAADTQGITRTFGGYRFVPHLNPDTSIHLRVYKEGTAKPVFAIRLQYVNTTHYHPYEFHHGSLYVILRMYDRMNKSPIWNDELWKFDRTKFGEDLYTANEIDFRASPDNRFVAVTDGSVLNQDGGHMAIINNDGLVVKRVSVENFAIGDFGTLYMTNTHCFFTETGPENCFDRFFKFNLESFTWTLKRLNGHSFCEEYDFNPTNETIIGSDYTTSSDIHDTTRTLKSETSVTLRTHSLKNGRSEIISTSQVKQRFNPRWMNDSIVEFNDPKTNSRVTFNVNRRIEVTLRHMP